MGLQGVCFGVTNGSVWMWYGSPGNLPISSKSSGYSSFISSLVLTILIFLAMSAGCIMDLFHSCNYGSRIGSWIQNGQLLCCVVLWILIVDVPLSWDNLLHLRLQSLLVGGIQVLVLHPGVVIGTLFHMIGEHCLHLLQCKSLLLQAALCPYLT